MKDLGYEGRKFWLIWMSVIGAAVRWEHMCVSRNVSCGCTYLMWKEKYGHNPSLIAQS